MTLADDIRKIEEKVEKVEEQGWAMSILGDYKRQNRRLFIIWIITFISFLALLGYTIYLLNDIGTIEEITTQEVTQNSEDGSNNFIGRDGDING